MSRSVPISIGQSVIGHDMPPLFLPDIDVYFKRDIDGARELVRNLYQYGVTTLKAAVLHDPDICLPNGIVDYYVTGEGVRRERYRDIIERHVVPIEDLRSVYSEARNIGMDLVLSIYDEAGLDLALEMGAVAIKVPSSNITHVALIRAAAGTGVPLLLDTGRATREEITRAVDWARKAGADKLIVQHSPPGPPAAAKDFNLRMMVNIGETYDCFDGLSDHYQGVEVMLAATALGADVIEKGVCFDGAESDIDIAHALQISDVPALLERINVIHSGLGKATRTMPPDRSLPDRMGLVAKYDMESGTILTSENIRFAFPAVGIKAECWDSVIGKSLRRRYAAGEPIKQDDVHL